jgi:dipeptidyl aminopeptidase/acylaminoacyl peptidase
MSEPRPLACGTWPSPLSADRLAGATLRLSSPALGADGSVYWLEGRPAEGGRNVLVRRRPDGAIGDVTPAPFNVRSRVHEYGGGAYAIRDDEAFFVDFPDQRLYRLHAGAPPTAVTTAGPWRLGDLVIDPRRPRLYAVGERHDPGAGEPENAIVSVDLATGSIDVLVRGADFYASPCPSPDGRQLAWLSWSHPHMPWDAAALFVAPLDEAGRPGPARHVAGDARASVFQPGWAADGSLVFAFEPEGFWNLHRARDGELQALTREPAEFGLPLWGLGTSVWGFADERTIVAASVEQGRSALSRIDLASGRLAPLPVPSTAIAAVAAGGGRAVLLAGAPDRPQAVVLLDLGAGTAELLATSASFSLEPTFVSQPEALAFPTSDGDTAHAFFYPPCNPGFCPLPGERPPLIVTAHGGPTGATAPVLSLAVQFWTTRGFAVLDVNYRGSTGYGRRYRDRLAGQWGVYDVDDCVAGARALAAAGRVDGQRLAIRGGSAGGYTVLAALAFRDAFHAGASHYGVSDLEALARDTHKFESRYTDWLVAPYPAGKELYVARSPVNFPDRLSCPVIFFQGLEDKVVPPSQAESMVAALRKKGLAAPYHAFPGEQHGFRRADTIRQVYEAELAFYGEIFGFSPAGPTRANSAGP